MTFAQRSKGESRRKTSEYLKEDVRPMSLCWANVRSRRVYSEAALWVDH